MSFAGGVFTRLYSYVADAAAGITAQPSRFDADLNDMANGLSTCVLRDGTGTPTTNIGFGGYKITGLGLGVSSTDAASLANLGTLLTGATATGGFTLSTGNLAVSAGSVTVSSSVTASALVTAGNVVGNAIVSTTTITGGGALSITAGGAAITGTVVVTGIVISNGIELGFRDVPQNPQAAAYTLALTDRGQHVYYTGAAAAITIPANATVAFPIGAAITLVNDGTGALTLTRAALVTMKLVGTGANLDRSLAIAGIATFIKVGTNTWFLSGTGIT